MIESLILKRTVKGKCLRNYILSMIVWVMMPWPLHREPMSFYFCFWMLYTNLMMLLMPMVWVMCVVIMMFIRPSSIE